MPNNDSGDIPNVGRQGSGPAGPGSVTQGDKKEDVVVVETDLTNGSVKQAAILDVEPASIHFTFHGSYPEDKEQSDRGPPVTDDFTTESNSSASSSGETVKGCHLEKECILHSPFDSARVIRTDVAFGDGEGTIAYTNEFGELICAMRMLDLGPTGLIRAKRIRGVNLTPKDHMERIVQGEYPGIGIRIFNRPSRKDLLLRSTEFVHDQWPRCQYGSPQIDVQVQYAIVDGRIVQEMVVTNKSEVDITERACFDLGMVLESPYMRPPTLKATLGMQGGIFTTGPTAVTLAGGPGGCVEFSASLFEDGRSVPLQPREHPFSPAAEPGGHTARRMVHNLIHELPITVRAKQEKKFTAIYQFELHSWSREQVHGMKLITNKLYPGAAIIGKEKKFLAAYEKAKSGNAVQARKLVEDGHCEETGAAEEDPETEGPTKEKRLFSNWGGDQIWSYRLFGQEWHRVRYRVVNRRLQEEMDWHKPLFDEEFAQLRTMARNKNVPVFVDAADFLRKSCPGKWMVDHWKQGPNFLFRRHLQLLLSVTSIPVRWSENKRTAHFFSDGDMFKMEMDHTTSMYDEGLLGDDDANSERHQFRFLLSMHQLLETGNIVDNTLKTSLQGRIIHVCKSHVEWCFDVAQKTKSGSWAPLYRPFGSIHSDVDDLASGAINFIKLYELWQDAPQLQDFILGKMIDRLEGWLNQLESSKNQKSGLWEEKKQELNIWWTDGYHSQLQEVGVPQYDLRQSILIWNALKSIRIIADEAKSGHSGISPLSSKELEDLLDKISFRDNFSPVTLQELILDRFSFDHTFPTHQKLQRDDSGTSPPNSEKPKRLIATSRSGSQKPRFHWHADSVNLCAGYDGGIFDSRTNMSEPSTEGTTSGRLKEWENTLHLQQYQHEALWKKPSRYALALVLAANSQCSLDESQNHKSMIERCSHVLFGSVLADGKVAEKLDPMTKAPQKRLTNYPSVVYSIPYYLLQTAYSKLLTRPTKTVTSGGEEGDIHAVGGPSTRRVWKTYKYEKSVRSIRKRGFYAMINEANVFENPCEPDWLFDDPDFFTKEDQPSDDKAIREMVRDVREELREMTDEMKDHFKVIDEAVTHYRADESLFVAEPDSDSDSDTDTDDDDDDDDGDDSAALVDVIKPDETGSNRQEKILRPRNLFEKLRMKREKQAVKKRLIYVYNCSLLMALALYLGAVGIEKFFIPGFLRRHQRRDVFLRDETRKEVNSWVTELQLSFFCIVQKSARRSKDSDGEEDEGLKRTRNTIFSGNPTPCPGRKDWTIEKGAIGFHFVGDLNDRYWTSHVAAYLPRGTERWLADECSFDLKQGSGEGNKNVRHSQRKILEARWFAEATNIIVEETRHILDYVAGISGQDDIGFCTPNHYDSFSQTFDQNKKMYVLYGDIFKFLCDVQESLRSIKAKAGEWESRHLVRETQPRWTRDDEAAYAEEIRIWERMSTAHLKMIEQLADRVESKINHFNQLRQWMIDDLNLKEARLSNRSADDVRIFTYATVVFLPLSFASSIFSMAGSPSHSTVVSFATAAVTALLATILFILNAGTPMRVFQHYKSKIFRLPEDSFVMEHTESLWLIFFRALGRWCVTYPAQRVLDTAVLLGQKKAEFQKRRSSNKQGGLSQSKKLPFPAKDSTSAEEEEREKKDVELERNQGRQNIFTLAFGLVLSPLFILVFIVRFILMNAFDIMKLLFYILPQYPFRRLEYNPSLEDKKPVASPSSSRKSWTSTNNSRSMTSLDSTARSEGSDSRPKENTKKKMEKQRRKKERVKRDIQRAEEHYRDQRLTSFLKLPRIDDVSKHLAKGMNLKAAWEAKGKDAKQRKRELKKKRAAVEKAKSKWARLEGNEQRGEEVDETSVQWSEDTGDDVASSYLSDSDTSTISWKPSHKVRTFRIVPLPGLLRRFLGHHSDKGSEKV